MRPHVFGRKAPHVSHVGVVALVFALLLGAHIAESAGYVDLVGGQEPANDPALSTKLTVTSLAYVRNQPDVATINTGISASAGTSAEAEAAIRRMLDRVGAAMGERGHTVTAGHFSIYPRYDFREDSAPVIIGFEARRQLEVVVTEIDRVGEAVQLLLDLGIHEINGINYGLRDEAPARREAIRRALVDARAQAESVAELNGQKVAGLLSISIDSSVQAYFGGPVLVEAATSLTPSPATVQVAATVEFLLASPE